MKENYQVTFWSYIRPLFFVSFMLLFLIFILIDVNFNSVNKSIIVIPVSIIFIIPIVLTIIIHINYINVERNVRIEFNTIKNEIIIVKENNCFNIRIEDIDRVRIVSSSDYSKPKPWNSHYYYIICMKNDDEYILTSLTVPNIVKKLNVRFVNRRVYLPYITKKTLNKVINY